MIISAVGGVTQYEPLQQAQSASGTQAVQPQGAGAAPKGGSAPPAGAPPAGGTPPSGGGGKTQAASSETSSTESSSSSSAKIYDPKDTNKDGKVSYEEEMAYAIKHPEEAAARQTANASQNTTYNRLGSSTNSTESFTSMINLSA